MKASSVALLLSALVAGAQASPVRRQNAAITETQLTGMQLLAQYAAAAYCNGENKPQQAIACSKNNTCPLAEAHNATTVASFTGLLTDMEGFVAVDPVAEMIVLSFRGSHTVRNWIDDFLIDEVSCTLTSDCLVHQGFYEAWQEVEADVLSALSTATSAHPTFPLIVTGHSLGAAVATLAAAYLRVAPHNYTATLYTYGSPRVGNAALANFVTAQSATNGSGVTSTSLSAAGVIVSGNANIRVTHLDDPVPRLPPLDLDYAHTSPEYWLSDGTAKTTNYTTADVRVCLGDTNTQCNGGEGGFDTEAHLFYFDAISACDPAGLEF